MLKGLVNNKDKGIAIERWEGVSCYLEGHPYPLHNPPNGIRIRAINEIKKKLKRLPFSYFELQDTPTYAVHHPIAKEVSRVFNNPIGRAVASVLEYDSAYRYRLQDLLSETTKERLYVGPWHEVDRLERTLQARDSKVVSSKFRFIATFLKIVLLLPSIRAWFRKAISQIEYSNLLPTEADTYWMKQRIDYKHGG